MSATSGQKVHLDILIIYENTLCDKHDFMILRHDECNLSIENADLKCYVNVASLLNHVELCYADIHPDVLREVPFAKRDQS